MKTFLRKIVLRSKLINIDKTGDNNDDNESTNGKRQTMPCFLSILAGDNVKI